MNSGAFKISNNFLPENFIDDSLNRLVNFQWKPVWEDKKYAGDHWLTCSLIKDFQETENFQKFPVAAFIKENIKCKIKSLMFYSMLPGGEVHEHRDMDGNVGLGGLRFHIPIKTNENVIFTSSGKRAIMGVNEFWALDTSYLHSVANFGNEERIHIVMIVEVNEWVRQLLPPLGINYRIHQLHLMLIAGFKVIKYAIAEPKSIKSFFKVILMSFKMLLKKK